MNNQLKHCAFIDACLNARLNVNQRVEQTFLLKFDSKNIKVHTQYNITTFMIYITFKTYKDLVMPALRFIPKSSFLSRTLLLLMVSFSINAGNTDSEKSMMDKVDIPVIEGARIFAKFDENTPAVINYFTSVTEDAVINFYNKSYGEPIDRERKRGRLTLNYQQKSQQIRVVISQQNKLRQVDIIVDKKMTTP